MTISAQNELAEVVGFEVDEVKTNATGKLSNRQRNRLRVMSFFIFIISLTFALLIWRAYSVSQLPQCYGRCDTILLLRGTVGIIFCIVTLFVGARFSFWLPKVQSKTGQIKIYGGLGSFMRPFKVVVGNTGLSIGWATWNMILPDSKYEGDVYVYYLSLA
jgi:hypothetical protein